MTPQTLLNRIRSDRAALAALWKGLAEEQVICRPGPQADWSVKDLIAHITWWESYILERVADLMEGNPSEPSEHHDILNARTYQAFKDHRWDEVLTAFEANEPKWAALISSLTDEQLNTPAYYPTYDAIALLPIIRAGSIGHYPTHMDDLQSYVERVNHAPQS